MFFIDGFGGGTGLGYDGRRGLGRDDDGSGALGFGNSLTGFGRYGNQDGLGDRTLSDRSRALMGQDHAQHGGLGMGGLSNASGELGDRLGKVN